jgi:hypothetical protein
MMKPSELPAGTVIHADKPYEDCEYIKREGGYWEDTYSGCGCCEDPVRVSDTSENLSQIRLTTKETSDDYFKDFRIISVPWVYLVQAVTMLQDEYGHTDAEGEDITFESVYACIAEEADRIIADKD